MLYEVTKSRALSDSSTLKGNGERVLRSNCVYLT